MVALLLKRAKNKFQAKTTFTTSGYSRPAAPVHLQEAGHPQDAVVQRVRRRGRGEDARALGGRREERDPAEGGDGPRRRRDRRHGVVRARSRADCAGSREAEDAKVSKLSAARGLTCETRDGARGSLGVGTRPRAEELSVDAVRVVTDGDEGCRSLSATREGLRGGHEAVARGVDAVIQSAAYARGTEMRGVEVAHDRLDGRSEDFVRQLGRSPRASAHPLQRTSPATETQPLARARPQAGASARHLPPREPPRAFSLARSKRRIVVLHVFDRPRDVGAHPVEPSATRARAPVAVDECRWRATSKLTCDCTRVLWRCRNDFASQRIRGMWPSEGDRGKRSHQRDWSARLEGRRDE